VEVPIEESLPAPQAVDRILGGDHPSRHSVRILIEIKNPIVPTVHRDHHVDVEVSERVPGPIDVNLHQVHIPGNEAIRVVLEQGAVIVPSRCPARIREAHTDVKQNEDALQAGTPSARLESLRQFELVRDDVAQADAGKRAEVDMLAMPAPYHLDPLRSASTDHLADLSGDVAGVYA
jgi:hypothetical protein